MIKFQVKSPITWERRWWQAAFALLLSAAFLFALAPEVSADELSLLSDSIATAMTGVAKVEADRILLTGRQSDENDMVLPAGKKVTILHGDRRQFATSRANERISALLQREDIEVGPLEMVHADFSGDEIRLEIAADFTYYDTVAEPAAYETVHQTDYTLPKGETRVAQPGIVGHRDVTYEVVYADGAFVSRQAVAVSASTAVNEIISTGTLVKQARQGDTIDSVIQNEDGSGYLLMKSGDSLHFTGSMQVKCTAYTAGVGVVNEITATGTRVHVGVVAVDKRVIPLGTTMFITTNDGSYTYGMGHAEDTGVLGHSVDLYMNSYNECMRFGRRSSTVYFLDV